MDLKSGELVVSDTIEPDYPVMREDLSAYLLVVIGRFREVKPFPIHNIFVSSYFPGKVDLLFKEEVLEFGNNHGKKTYLDASRAMILDSLNGFVEESSTKRFELNENGREAYLKIVQDAENDRLFPYTATIISNVDRQAAI